MQALNAAQLARYGITNVVEIPDYQTRTTNAARPFTPVGFMAHHTAGSDSLDLIIRKALANYHIDKSGRISVVAVGRTAHPGYGAQSVIDDCAAGRSPRGDASRFSPRAVDPTQHLDPDGERVPGYQWFIGAEVENLGTGSDPYPDVQLDALFKLAAAHCIEFGWSSSRVIHHREFTSRKIDMSWYGDLRGSVSAAIATLRQENTPMALHDEAQAAADAGLWNGQEPKTPISREHAAIIGWRAYGRASAEAGQSISTLQASNAELRAMVTSLAERVHVLETADPVVVPAAGGGTATVEFPADIPVRLDVNVNVTGGE